MRKLFFFGSVLGLLGCGTAPEKQTELTPVQMTAAYVPRIGIAVRTEARTCVGIRNANLAMSSPITLVMPNVPQFFVPARIKAPSENACPISKELDPGVSDYELTLLNGDESIPKLTPMIAVVGDSSSFLRTNVTVQADLDHDKGARMFRSCGSGDGVHLTVWSGAPVTSSVLW